MTSEFPTRTLAKVGNSYRVTIPSDLVKGFGWGEGTKVRFKILGPGKLEILEVI
ncbi:MAG: AbrB/MazE/SpoVT family DNA-binding domain-containing protein [Halobacteriota archaeon]|nr:AbrB/MazE/SpoVT family DNA-binding domain-containing protein [Halobacteriota archaeon]MDY6931580.1 AbrB/MazE/SpoVT family DNA-binding domain-containing protein [Halobacteriota archaeon]